MPIENKYKNLMDALILVAHAKRNEIETIINDKEYQKSIKKGSEKDQRPFGDAIEIYSFLSNALPTLSTEGDSTPPDNSTIGSNQGKDKELSKLTYFSSQLSAIYKQTGDSYKKNIKELFMKVLEELNTPGERKVLLSQNESEIRKHFGSKASPIAISKLIIINPEEDLFENRPDENITAYEWLKLKWGDSLLYFKDELNTNIQRDYLFNDELKDYDSKLAKALHAQSLTKSSKGVSVTDMIPTKDIRTKREVKETPRQLLKENNRIERLRIKYEL